MTNTRSKARKKRSAPVESKKEETEGMTCHQGLTLTGAFFVVSDLIDILIELE